MVPRGLAAAPICITSTLVSASRKARALFRIALPEAASEPRIQTWWAEPRVVTLTERMPATPRGSPGCMATPLAPAA